MTIYGVASGKNLDLALPGVSMFGMSQDVADRPAPGHLGRVWVVLSPPGIFADNGTAWVSVGAP